MTWPGPQLAVAQTAENLLVDLGLLGLALLMALENVFPPIPSEVILPLAGYLAAQGDLPAAGALAAATAGSLAGSMLLYEAARRGGRPLVLRHARLLRLSPRDIDRAEAWFLRRGPLVVLVGRCIPGVRSLVSLPAGLLRMNRASYLLLTLAGTLVWNLLLLGAGWVLGTEWERASAVVGSAAGPVLAVLALAGAVALAVRWRRAARAETR